MGESRYQPFRLYSLTSSSNSGVLKSVMAEMCDETNLAHAFAYVPIAWSAGGTIGCVSTNVYIQLASDRIDLW